MNPYTMNPFEYVLRWWAWHRMSDVMLIALLTCAFVGFAVWGQRYYIERQVKKQLQQMTDVVCTRCNGIINPDRKWS